MSGDVHVRFCERLGGKFPGATRLVIGFQHEDDARRVMDVLPKRFGKYGLELHPEKSRLLDFSRPARTQTSGRGVNTFDFVGFTHYWARSRRGFWVIKRKTAGKKVRKTIQGIRDWCRRNRHKDIVEQHRVLSSKLRGHYQYFGVRGNLRAMAAVRDQVRRAWRYWLHRRSSKKAMPWDKFAALLERIHCRRPKSSTQSDRLRGSEVMRQDRCCDLDYRGTG